MTDEAALKKIARSVTLFRSGIFCPAVLWEHVSSRLVAGNAGKLLDGLPPDLQLVLREAYRGRPHSLRTGARDESVSHEVETWFKRADA